MIDTDAINETAAQTGAAEVATRLGLELARGATPEQARACCPWHVERRPACSIARRQGRIVARCHACGSGGDFLALVAAVYGLDPRTDFRRVAELAAELVGVHLEEGDRPAPRRAIDPSADLARVIDRLADEWGRGLDLHPPRGGWPREADERALEAAGPDRIAAALRELREVDAIRAERFAELDRFAREYEARQALLEVAA